MNKNNLQFSKQFYSHGGGGSLKELIEIVACWEFLFRDPLNEHCSPNNLFQETLFIDCNPHCLMDVMSHNDLIMNNINIFFAKILVKNIVIKPRFF